jgi:hypothetical protein
MSTLQNLIVEPVRAPSARFSTPATKKKAPARRRRNPFAREGWRQFIMRSVSADGASGARVTATGETLHLPSAWLRVLAGATIDPALNPKYAFTVRLLALEERFAGGRHGRD